MTGIDLLGVDEDAGFTGVVWVDGVVVAVVGDGPDAAAFASST